VLQLLPPRWQQGKVTIRAPSVVDGEEQAMEESNIEELAKAMYNGYGERRRWRVASGAAMPRWEEQAEDFRDGWRAAALAGEQHLRATDKLR
jgi:hypothetical protein